ncbi:MAG: hypothetical protein ACQEWF_22805 [Bacillota bacterium]
MTNNETLTLKSNLHEVKLKLINLGMSLEDEPFTKEGAFQVFVECIHQIEEIDDSVKVVNIDEIYSECRIKY